MTRDTERHSPTGSLFFRRSRLPIVEVTAEKGGISGLPVDEIDLPTMEAICADQRAVVGVPVYFFQYQAGVALWPRPEPGVTVRVVSGEGDGH